jgi:ketosteroid isomerase-like protein
MTTDARVAIACVCYEAYVAKDRTAIEALLAENFHFTSPIDNRLDRTTYFARCWPNSQRIDAFDFIHLVPEGDKVFVTYEGQNTDGHRIRNTEIITVRGNQIVEVEVYFGWSIPHEAPAGGFIGENQAKRQQLNRKVRI